MYDASGIDRETTTISGDATSI
ncbi:unnamed protein product, partial [Rotaria sp. Silwood2]